MKNQLVNIGRSFKMNKQGWGCKGKKNKWCRVCGRWKPEERFDGELCKRCVRIISVKFDGRMK